MLFLYYLIVILLLNYPPPARFLKNLMIPSANASGISFITFENDRFSLTPTAIAIETVNPINANVASFKASFIPERIV